MTNIVIFKYEEILVSISNQYIRIIANIDTYILFIGIIFSLVFCLQSIKPFLRSGNVSEKYTSVLFFGLMI